MTLARLEPRAGGDARGWVELMGPAIELAKAVASTDFVPRSMRNNPAAISAAILYGDEVGLGPMQSLAKIAVIEGRPFIAAEAQRALVLAAGHDLWLDELTATRATWCGRRAGRDEVTRITWTLDDARRAGIVGKQNWRAYPRQMLSARASAELVRAVFADVVGGLAALEEFDDLEVDGGDADSGSGSAAPTTKRRRRRTAGAVVPDDGPRVVNAAEVLPLLPDEALDVDAPAAVQLTAADVGPSPEPEPEPATRRQKGRLHELLRERGITERGDRMRLASAVIGRVVTSSTELTAAEADAFTTYLEGQPVPPPEPERAGDEPDDEPDVEGPDA